jgi:hypothetical protein
MTTEETLTELDIILDFLEVKNSPEYDLPRNRLAALIENIRAQECAL